MIYCNGSCDINDENISLCLLPPYQSHQLHKQITPVEIYFNALLLLSEDIHYDQFT